MSRWLQSVNTLLEQLDGKVETAVEDQIIRADDEQQAVQTDVLDDILTKRGLVAVEDQKEGEHLDAESAQIKDRPEVSERENEVDAGNDSLEFNSKLSEEAMESSTEGKPYGDEREDFPQRPVEGVSSEQTGQVPVPDITATIILEGDQGTVEETEAEGTTDAVATEHCSESMEETSDPESAIASPEPAAEMSKSVGTEDTATPTLHNVVVKTDPLLGKDYEAALADVRRAQKEAKTLRRHVVSLNAQLEAAEAEMSAQRTELERAAERMERDRARHKEEKQRQTARHAEELKSLKYQHEVNAAENKARSDQQLEDARKRLRLVEERRMQEGGDWTKELEEAIQREQVAAQRVSMLEDEKSTLLSQVSTLESQQAALESRVESVTETAENAMERETEAEDRLDAALSLHARQLSQRQSREAELERTVADLGAALVVARNREVNRLKAVQQEGTIGEAGSSEGASLKAGLEAMEDELETVKAQLDLERQRCQTLHSELRDISQERTEEASATYARQLQYDRQIADMSLTISRFQANLRDSKKESFRDSKEGNAKASFAHERGDDTQIKALSEQVVRQQEKIGNYTSEISALKSRLRSALSRAESAEHELSVSGNTGGMLDIMERAPSTGNSSGGWPRTMRKRGGSRGRADSYGGSIRSAMRLEPGQTDGKEKIGKAIDALDTWSVETGMSKSELP